jgi:uncharacterized protein (DUF1697 family)
MATLARHVAEAGATDVTTVLASGNVVFRDRRSAAACAKALERHLAGALGFEVPVLIRTRTDLANVADSVPFPRADVLAAHAVYVGFAGELVAAAPAKQLASLSCATDVLRVVGREVWWLRRAKESSAQLTNTGFDRVAGQPLTFRTLPTVAKVLALMV